MRESFAIDRETLYGFDYDNTISQAAAWAAAWAQNDETVFEEALEGEVATEEVAQEVSEEVMEEAVEVAMEEVSAKEAFFEFARGPVVRPPQHHRPPHIQPHPMPVVPPRPNPGVGHHFNPHSGSAPRFAPPAYVPQRAPGLRAIDPGAISRCLYSNTYVWLNNRQEFWFFPTFIGRKSIAGYRWMHRHWVFMGFSLNMIDSFFCGGR